MYVKKREESTFKVNNEDFCDIVLRHLEFLIYKFISLEHLKRTVRKVPTGNKTRTTIFRFQIKK